MCKRNGLSALYRLFKAGSAAWSGFFFFFSESGILLEVFPYGGGGSFYVFVLSYFTPPFWLFYHFIVAILPIHCDTFTPPLWHFDPSVLVLLPLHYGSLTNALYLFYPSTVALWWMIMFLISKSKFKVNSEKGVQFFFLKVQSFKLYSTCSQTKDSTYHPRGCWLQYP